MPDCKVGDYVSFAAIVESEEFMVTNRRGETTRKAVKLITPQRGSGQVRRLTTTRMKAVPPRHVRQLEVEREAVTIAVRTARIDAGPMLGVVTAVLHGGELVGEQLAIGGAA